MTLRHQPGRWSLARVAGPFGSCKLSKCLINIYRKGSKVLSSNRPRHDRCFQAKRETSHQHPAMVFAAMPTHVWTTSKTATNLYALLCSHVLSEPLVLTAHIVDLVPRQMHFKMQQAKSLTSTKRPVSCKLDDYVGFAHLCSLCIFRGTCPVLAWLRRFGRVRPDLTTSGKPWSTFQPMDFANLYPCTRSCKFLPTVLQRHLCDLLGPSDPKGGKLMELSPLKPLFSGLCNQLSRP